MTGTPVRILVVANRTAAAQRLLTAVEKARHGGALHVHLARARRRERPRGRLDPRGRAAPAVRGGGEPRRGPDRWAGPLRGGPGGGRHRRVRRDHHLDAAAGRVEVAAAWAPSPPPPARACRPRGPPPPPPRGPAGPG